MAQKWAPEERRYYLGPMYPAASFPPSPNPSSNAMAIMGDYMTPPLGGGGYENYIAEARPDLQAMLANVLAQGPTGAPPGDPMGAPRVDVPLQSLSPADMANDYVETPEAYPQYPYDDASWFGFGMNGPQATPAAGPPPIPQQPNTLDAQAEQMYASVQPNPVDQYMTMGRQMASEMANDYGPIDRAYELSVAARTGKNVGEVLNEQKARRINAMNALTAQVNSEIAYMNAMKGSGADQWSVLSPEEEAALGLDPAGVYNRNQAGEIKVLQGIAEAGGAPKVREYESGDEKITEEWDPAAKVWKPIARAPRYKPAGSTSTTTIINEAENKYQGNEAGKAAEALRASGEKAASKLQNVSLARLAADQWIKEGGTFGPFSGMEALTSKVVGTFGDPTAFGLPSTASGFDVMQQVANRMTVDLIGAANGADGFPANNFSDADRSFVQKIVAQPTDSKEGYFAKLRMAEIAAKADLERSNAFVQFKIANPNQGMLEFTNEWTKYRANKPVFGPAEQAEIAKILSGGAEKDKKSQFIERYGLTPTE